MAEPFIGQITLFGFNFAPRGWAQCNGQLMPISQNTALFSLLGTNYGGNGTTTFALPSLQGTAPVGAGTPPGRGVYELGETGGSDSVTLNNSTVPPHTHTISASNTSADKNTLAANLVPAKGASGGGKGGGALAEIYAPGSAGAQVSLAPAAISVAGGSQPHNNVQPTLTANWCIAVQGIFPPRQ